MEIKKTDQDKTSIKADDKPSIVVAYSGAHPAHQKLLDDCCGESIKMLGEWSVDEPPSNKKKLLAYLGTAYRLRANPADIIVIEGATPAFLMAPMIKFLNRRKKTIIALCADDAMYRAFIEGNRLLGMLIQWGFRYVSGVVSVGDLTARLVRKYLKSLPVEVRYPPVSESLLSSMAEVEPSLNSHNLLLIGGRNAYCKGVDIAAKCLDILRATFPDAALTILGFPDLEEKPGVTSPGPVVDIAPYLSSSSVLIHPARGDSFPVATVEAMLAGVVPFISEWTGTSELAKKISPELDVPLSSEEFAGRIGAFWSASPEYRKALSDKCRQTAAEFCAQAANQPSLRPFIERFKQPTSS